MRGVWIVVALVACGEPGSVDADDPVTELEALASVANQHREEVQGSFDMNDIWVMESNYDLLWSDALARVRAALDAEGCLDHAADEGSWTAAAWIDNLEALVVDHITQSEGHLTFQECWSSEDGHHHDIVDGIDAIEAAYLSCRS